MCISGFFTCNVKKFAMQLGSSLGEGLCLVHGSSIDRSDIQEKDTGSNIGKRFEQDHLMIWLIQDCRKKKMSSKQAYIYMLLTLFRSPPEKRGTENHVHFSGIGTLLKEVTKSSNQLHLYSSFCNHRRRWLLHKMILIYVVYQIIHPPFF